MKANRRMYKRTLLAEQLERRELLAASAVCQVAPTPAGSQDRDTEMVRICLLTTDEEITPRTQRDRIGEENQTGVGRQLRPRDRAVDDVVANADLTALVADAVATAQCSGATPLPTEGQLPLADGLTETEIEQLLFVREEEKLARDVYLALAEMWNLPIFANIAESEQRHMDAVGQLIDQYGLDDPIVDDTPGVFANETLQQLYNDLVGKGDVDLEYLGIDLVIEGGSASPTAALHVGAFIEEFDILDLRNATESTSHSDVEMVYDHLTRGSRNHLRSFVTQIEATGEVYQPVLMTDDLYWLYQEIMGGEQEIANGMGRGVPRRGGGRF